MNRKTYPGKTWKYNFLQLLAIIMVVSWASPSLANSYRNCSLGLSKKVGAQCRQYSKDSVINVATQSTCERKYYRIVTRVKSPTGGLYMSYGKLRYLGQSCKIYGAI